MNRLPAQKNKPKQTQFHLPPFLAQIQGFAPKIRKNLTTSLHLGRKIFGFPNKVFAKKRRK